ncbi:hypothetical protein K1T71_009101 [Dendrolimus kikuchii]|uniref:Uncharacterized protein n=1 Tax=Dendrolimus kikuchii TaxID=765133 RepID=A0ACC1CTL3_9NEOP|nr:hypothetical protein K1T71_009101 [Dendrolimus kikuchii]
MLINKIDSEGAGEGSIQKDHSHEYQTASELFELMAGDHDFQNAEEDLSTRDLVILYKNIDIGTKLMSNANDINQVRRPNQHVETVVYADDPESDGSEMGEIYSTEDIQNTFILNKERIDLLNNGPSFENTLCQKLGDLEIQSSQLSTEYDKHFLFQDSYIKKQLKSLKLMSTKNGLEESVLPTSLLDYICCKRLEDNYNFYMDNIIHYVKQTIEQLKRISNGDYLTNRAKEMWKEVDNAQNHQNTKVLATSTSIPLQVERKASGLILSWDDIVHSEVDVRSLSKILEKEIVLEVPKLICGTYKLFSKHCADNLIISCKRENVKSMEEDTKSRVDVVLQLKRFESGQVISNISSIMILQAVPTIQQGSYSRELLSLPCIKPEDEKEVNKEKRVRIVEIDKNESNACLDCNNQMSKNGNNGNESHHEGSFILDSTEYTCIENEGNSSKSHSYQESNESNDALRDLLDRKEAFITKTLNIISPDELRMKMQSLNMQTSLPEESGEDLSPRVNQQAYKQKSPTRMRIKSPYENKSHALEEKKRKKLLEIREKRERKKLAMGERYKINKKYGKSATMPQSSNSVTKLSITNKSFYNSIYGQNIPSETKSFKSKAKSMKKQIIPEISLNDTEGECEQSIDTPDRNSTKYINRSYYLDEAETEMMYLKTKQLNNGVPKDLGSASTSAVSNDFRVNLSLLSQLIGPSESDLDSKKDANSTSMAKESIQMEEDKKSTFPLDVIKTHSSINTVPANSPKDIQINNNNQIKKTSSAMECRESIKQIYDLMKEIKKNNVLDVKPLKGEITNYNNEEIVIIEAHGSSTIQGSDSGTSLKHYQTSSVPSCFSFDKVNVEETTQRSIPNKQSVTPPSVVPKVIINTKVQAPILDKIKKEKRVVINTPIKVPENPLRAISQILHEFENVQKTRQRPIEPKLVSKKGDTPTADIKSGTRQNSFLRRFRVDQNKDADVDKLKKITPRQKNPRAIQTDVPKIPHYQITIEDKRDKIFRKKLADIIDQAKEARGEAVRGPCKFPSRLNALAQPKRSYVQAHSDEYHTKYGRNLMTNRLQRLASNSLSAQRPPASASSRNKIKRTEATSAVSVKHAPSVPPLVRYPVTNHIHKSTESSVVAPSYKHKLPKAPESLKRMVAVESYVNSHYGRALVGDSLHRPLKSRVPLLPTDISLATEVSNNYPEESTELGSKLHRIIDSIIEANPPCLAVLSEGVETSFKYSRNNTEDSFNDSLSKEDERISIDSDYQIDIFRDKNVKTAVNDAETLKNKEEYVISPDELIKHSVQPFNSFTEIQKLENALNRRKSVGAFQKRLRIKYLTLTPKQSMGQVFSLQSGDAELPVLKNTTLPHVKINKGESICELKSLSVLSKTHIDWRLASFPMQITTVGYSFPKYRNTLCTSSSKLVSLDDLMKDAIKTDNFHLNSSKSDEVTQCTTCYSNATEIVQSVKMKTLKSLNISHEDDIKTKDNASVESKSVEISSYDFKTPSSGIAEHTKEVKDKATYAKTHEHGDDVDYTTSLDMLVGLLNEIQKITSCQSQIANTDCQKLQKKELKPKLNNAAELETCAKDSSRDLTSIPSLDKLKQLESSPSIFTYYLSKREDVNEDMRNPSKIDTVENVKPASVDKEVSVNFLEREYVSNFTDVPSEFLPVTLNHSTNVTNSLIGVLSEPSSQSIFTFSGYQTYAMSSFENKQMIIQPPKLQKSNDSHNSLVPYVYKEKLSQETCVELFTPVDMPKKAMTQKYTLNNGVSALNNCPGTEEFDSILKMKRDVLVAFYSILVLTVFAALSFPEIMYNV